jgi:hypothetical protein
VLKKIKENLFLNRAIYHERVTLLIELIKSDVLEDRIKFEAKMIKSLNVASTEMSRFDAQVSFAYLRLFQILYR